MDLAGFSGESGSVADRRGGNFGGNGTAGAGVYDAGSGLSKRTRVLACPKEAEREPPREPDWIGAELDRPTLDGRKTVTNPGRGLQGRPGHRPSLETSETNLACPNGQTGRGLSKQPEPKFGLSNRGCSRTPGKDSRVATTSDSFPRSAWPVNQGWTSSSRIGLSKATPRVGLSNATGFRTYGMLHPFPYPPPGTP